MGGKRACPCSIKVCLAKVLKSGIEDGEDIVEGAGLKYWSASQWNEG